MVNSSYQDMDPRVVAYENASVLANARGPRKGHVKVEDQRRELRMSRRLAALESWEQTEPGTEIPWLLGNAGAASDASDGGEYAAC